MKVNRVRLRKLATITIKLHREEVPYDRDIEDQEAQAWIKEQLEVGNEWAWCTVEVIAEYIGASGSDYLGCCSYESEKNFKQDGGYYSSMVDVAVDNLALDMEKMLADEHLIEGDGHAARSCIQCIADECA